MGTFLDINIVRKIFIKPFTTTKKLSGNTVDGSVGIDDEEEKKKKQEKKSSAVGSFFKGILSPSGIKVLSIAIFLPLMFVLAPFSLPVLLTCTVLSVVGTSYSIYREGKNLRDLKVQQTEALLLKELADLKGICDKSGVSFKTQLTEDKSKAARPSNRLLTSTLPDSVISIGSAVTTLNPIAIGTGIFANMCNAVTTAERQRQIDNQQEAFENIRQVSMDKSGVKITPGAKGNIDALKKAINESKTALQSEGTMAPKIITTETKSIAHYMWTSFKAGFDPSKTAEQNAPLAKYKDIVPESLKGDNNLQYSYKIIDKNHNYVDHTYEFKRNTPNISSQNNMIHTKNWAEDIGRNNQNQTHVQLVQSNVNDQRGK